MQCIFNNVCAYCLGGTTVSIKYLAKWGYIKPMPSKDQLKKMYDDQKAKSKEKIKKVYDDQKAKFKQQMK